MLVNIVDDDEVTRQSLAFMLETAGLTTRGFASPQELLSMWDETIPSCLVVDFQLPEMSGLQLIQEIRLRGSMAPFLLITGHGTVPVVVQAMKLGAVTVIEKPFDHHHLLELLANLRDTIAQTELWRRLEQALQVS